MPRPKDVPVIDNMMEVPSGEAEIGTDEFSHHPAQYLFKDAPPLFLLGIMKHVVPRNAEVVPNQKFENVWAGIGHGPLIAATGVQIRYGQPLAFIYGGFEVPHIGQKVDERSNAVGQLHDATLCDRSKRINHET